MRKFTYSKAVENGGLRTTERHLPRKGVLDGSEPCAPGFEGRGHGRALMDLAEDLGRDHGAAEVSLIVAEQNSRARGLYERLGYAVRDRRPAVRCADLEHAGDWLLMVKPL